MPRQKTDHLLLNLGASTLLAMLMAGCAAPAPPQAAALCPLPAGDESTPLYGNWIVQIDGQPVGRLQLVRHPEYAGSVSGSYTRQTPVNTPAAASRIVGDIDQGELMLEESQDGKTTSGRWRGRWSPGDCANEIRGDWIDARQEQAVLSLADNKRGARPYAFVMHRSADWQ